MITILLFNLLNLAIFLVYYIPFYLSDDISKHFIMTDNNIQALKNQYSTAWVC